MHFLKTYFIAVLAIGFLSLLNNILTLAGFTFLQVIVGVVMLFFFVYNIWMVIACIRNRVAGLFYVLPAYYVMVFPLSAFLPQIMTGRNLVLLELGLSIVELLVAFMLLQRVRSQERKKK